MASLVDLLSRTSRGRIFLFNLYEALNSSPPCLTADSVRDGVWDKLSARLRPKETPGSALRALFDFLHHPSNRHLRFSRPAYRGGAGAYEVRTTTRCDDMLYDRDKRVVQFGPTLLLLGRKSRNEPWPDDQGELLCRCINDPKFRNGRDYAQKYDIFWASPDPRAADMDADTLRDRLGLVHIEKGERVVQLHFACEESVPTNAAAPTVIEATNHRRFKARPPRPPGRQAATAANLEPLRKTLVLEDGIEEIVLSAVPMDALIEAKHVGTPTEHADITPRPADPPWTMVEARDDRAYARALQPPVALDAMLTALKAMLE